MSVVIWRALYREGLPACPCTVTEETQGTESGEFVGIEDQTFPHHYFVKIGTAKI